MAGRGKDHVGAGRDGRGVQPIGVQLQGGQVGLRQQRAQGGIARILDHRAPPGGQQLRGEPESVLRAEGEEDFVRGGEDTPPGQGLPRQIVDQQRVVAVILVGGEAVEIALAQGLQGAKPPVGAVKQRGIGLSVDEIIPVGRPIGRLADPQGGGRGGQPGMPVHRARPRRPRRKLGRFGGVCADVIARAPLGRQVIIGHQFGIGQRHGDPGDAQMRCESTRRGQPLAGAETARQDALGHHLLNAGLQGAGGCGVEEKGVDGDHASGPKLLPD